MSGVFGMLRRWIPVCLALASCQSQPLSLNQLASPESYPAAVPGEASLLRLTQAQYEHSLTDLFGEDLVVLELAEPDTPQGGLISVGASISSYSPRGVESVEQSAFALAAQITQEPALFEKAMGCELADESCREQVASVLGRRLYRRALSQAELETLQAIRTTTSSALSPEEGVAFTLAAMLQSPNFLYRAELGADGPSRTLKGVELASRLSFFLWNSAPSDDLLTAAEAGALDTREGLFEWAARMLDDPKIYRGFRAYVTDWLELYELEEVKKDPTVFELYNTRVGEDAAEETLRLLEYIVLDKDGDFREIMTTRETYLNDYLAGLYGVPSPSETAFTSVLLPGNGGRVGLLGHASFLVSHAHVSSSSATLRGKAVRTRLLCQIIPAPPVDVDTSIPEPSGTTPTLRDRVAEHLANPSCAGCHQLLDPIGLGLENYDGMGRWRDTDNGVAIDVTGELDGQPFANPSELATAIAEHPGFAPCVVRTLSRYAIGRVETTSEQESLDVLTDRFTKQHGHSVRSLMMEIVMSPLFQTVGAPSQEGGE